MMNNSGYVSLKLPTIIGYHIEEMPLIDIYKKKLA